MLHHIIEHHCVILLFTLLVQQSYRLAQMICYHCHFSYFFLKSIRIYTLGSVHTMCSKDTFANLRSLHFLRSDTTVFTTHVIHPHPFCSFKDTPNGSFDTFSHPPRYPFPCVYTQHHRPDFFFSDTTLLSNFWHVQYVNLRHLSNIAPSYHRSLSEELQLSRSRYLRSSLRLSPDRTSTKGFATRSYSLLSNASDRQVKVNAYS